MSEEAERRSPLVPQVLLLVAFFVIAGIGIAAVVVPELTSDAEHTEEAGDNADAEPPDEPEE